jgi:TolB-like protein/tetratricopeptide (TPR) repeat protein/predicted Ser/Thr protein kinase
MDRQSPSGAQPAKIGRFRVLRRLGEGGMGVVFAAFDDRLDRSVAIKVLRPELVAGATADLLREARAAARVTHPNICQIYEVDEDDGRPFLVMELLDGESLAARIAQGPLSLDEALETTGTVLSALGVMHAQGLVHLDLKPANIIATPGGLKVLDFGLARRVSPDGAATQTVSLPAGTPAYMAPEQIRGGPLDARTDIFAAGVMLFEMIVGRPPFGGAGTVDILQSVLAEHPPSLSGSPALVAVDRVVQRALAKRPDDRFQTAAEMAAALDAMAFVPHAAAAVHVRSFVRIVVLPFRMLRPDPEVEFLALGLADAIGTTLARVDRLVVRSTLALPSDVTAADIGRVAIDLDVDFVLAGTVLRAGDRVRVTAQLVEAGTGHTTWSRVIDGSVGDVFGLQDTVASQILDSLPIAAAGDGPPTTRAPGSDTAYRLFLRANQFAREPATWIAARDLYKDSVEEDPEYAPSWAGLGRMLRVIAKFHERGPALEEGYRDAEAALARALRISPDLSLAHYHYAQLETDRGRTPDALRRLLRQARVHRTAPELFAGLVLVCRYCGLLDASVAAYEIARTLDPQLKTSIALTWMALGRFEDVLTAATDTAEQNTRIMALEALGRHEEALELARTATLGAAGEGMAGTMRVILAWLEGRHGDALVAMQQATGIDPGQPRVQPEFPDGEGHYFAARGYANFGRADLAIATLESAIARGFFCLDLFERDPWMAPVRALPEYASVLNRARARQREAVQVFTAEEGEALLGTRVAVAAVGR